jgi:hypothetical protein
MRRLKKRPRRSLKARKEVKDFDDCAILLYFQIICLNALFGYYIMPQNYETFAIS